MGERVGLCLGSDGGMTLVLPQFTRGEGGGRGFEQKEQRVPRGLAQTSGQMCVDS